MEEEINKYINNPEEAIKVYEELKRNKEHIGTIDIDFFFNLVDCILKRYKELEEENERLKYARNWYFENFTARACTPEMLDKILKFDYISKSKVKEKIEEWDKSIK